MDDARETFIPAKGVKSLCWFEDELIDWVAGGIRYTLEGLKEDPHIARAFSFDGATMSPSGRYAAIFKRLGTKGLLLDQGRILREINRSYYFAEAYDYPIALIQLPDGREVIVHCPEKYSRLEIDDLVTGERLTKREAQVKSDFFHSRLVVNPSATILVSAGWVWHPLDMALAFNIEEALANPISLDEGQAIHIGLSEGISSIAFLSDRVLLLYSSKEVYTEEDEDHDFRTEPGLLATYDLYNNAIMSKIQAEEIVGSMMPVGGEYIVGLYEHPKLIHVETGRVVQRWPHIQSGTQLSSILWSRGLPPPMALDPANRRFAVASDEGIYVVMM